MQCRLAEILKEQGRKNKWLAEKAGIDRNTITNLIKGSEPRLKMARKIAKALNTTLDDIWPDDESPLK